MWIIRYKDTATGSYTQFTVHPAPSSVEYPPKRLFKEKATQDNAVVIQRPLRDNRVRTWKWENYRDSVPSYAALFAQLQQFEYRTRLEAGKYPFVEVWEDESGVGGFDRKDGSGNPIFTQIKVTQVDRTVKPGSSVPTFTETTFEFYIADSNYTGF